MSDPVVERIARTLAVQSCCDECEPNWPDYLTMAEAVITDLGVERLHRAAVDDEGHIIQWLTNAGPTLRPDEHPVYRLRGAEPFIQEVKP